LQQHLYELFSGLSNLINPPSTHHLFSTLTFSETNARVALLDERDDGDAEVGDESDGEAQLGSHNIGRDKDVSVGARGGWLESDDIEDF
jgi:hypothetical protein